MFTRRHFLQRSTGLAALGSAPFASWLSLRALSSAVASSSPPEDYRALVCIFLNGGNDSFNMLVPRPHADPTSNWSGVDGSGTTGEDEWKAYCNLRGSASIPSLYPGALGGSVLPLFKTDTSTHAQALNAHMPRVQAIFNGVENTTYGLDPDGRHLAFVSNVGPLVEPVTAAQVRNRSKILPLYLQSHSDQIKQWQTCYPQGPSSTGWIGRMVDTVFGQEQGPDFSLISLTGNSTALTGRYNLGFADSNGSDLINRLVSYSDYTPRRTILQDILAAQQAAGAQQQTLARAYLDTMADGLQANVDYAGILDSAPPANRIPDNLLDLRHGLVGRMRRIAHIISEFRTKSATDASLPRRQIFFVDFGGWDHHTALETQHQQFLSVLDSALGEFYAQMQAIDALDEVTLFTASDFGRAIVPNGDGTDHAWGGNHIVMGGAVGGGEIYGQYPKLKVQGSSISSANSDPDNLDIYGNGVFSPTLSVDQYMQRLGQWFLEGTSAESWNAGAGQPTPEWSAVLPNWEAFKGIAPVTSNIEGFMES